MSQPAIHGSLVAIVTPMLPDGNIDWDAYKKLLEWHVKEGTHGIVAVGTTGESPTVTVEEHKRLIAFTVEVIANRIAVIAGAGGNSTAEAIELTRYAKEVGAHATLQVVPYYNKPTQEGMYQHFKAIAQAVDLPVILYNVPGRTIADMSNETVLRLAQIPNIIGIKDATGDIGRGIALIDAAPAGFKVISGDDGSAVALMLMGAVGNISVTANVAPRTMSAMCVAAMAGKASEARALHCSLLPIHKTMFIEANPIPVKWAMTQMGLMQNGIRLPLTELSSAGQTQVAQALAACKAAL